MKLDEVKDLTALATEALTVMLQSPKCKAFIGNGQTLTVESLSGTYSSVGAILRFKFSDPALSTLREEEDFRTNALHIGIKPTLWGHIFKHKGRTYTVSGLKLNRKKYPITATRDDGETFKFSARHPAFGDHQWTIADARPGQYDYTPPQLEDLLKKS